jgi:hypothetical protein
MVSDPDPLRFRLGAELREALGWQLRELYRGMAAAAPGDECPARLRELLDRLDERGRITSAGSPLTKPF